MRSIRNAHVLTFGLLMSIWGVGVRTSAETLEVQTLIAQLQSGDWRIRAEAAPTLGKQKEVAAQIRVTALLSALSAEIEKPLSLQPHPKLPVTVHEHLRGRYVRALVHVGPEAIPLLKQHLKVLRKPDKKSEMAERQWILLTLGLLKDGEVFADVIRLLKSKDGFVRATAAEALGRIANKAAIPQLKQALRDDFQLKYTTDLIVNGSNTRILYPVRESACSALIRLGVRVEKEGNDFRGVD